jgi:hypothetical protein
LFAGKWMELKITVLSEMCQTEKDNSHMFSPMWTLDMNVTNGGGESMKGGRKKKEGVGGTI